MHKYSQQSAMERMRPWMDRSDAGWQAKEKATRDKDERHRVVRSPDSGQTSVILRALLPALLLPQRWCVVDGSI
jgi:hypothetical protein